MNEKKSVFAAIVGKPNVGKSSIMNALVGEKIAIVTPKPQTTRNRIRGILTKEETQFVFIDTPGLHQAKTRLGDYMVKQVRETVAEVDVIVLVVEPAPKITKAEEELIENIKLSKTPAILVINKTDTLANREGLLERISQFKALYDFAAYVPTSAKTQKGLDGLLAEIDRFAQIGPHYFSDDEMTDQPEKILAAEIIREKVLMHLQEEVPHGIGIVVETMKDRADGKLVDVGAVIYCERKTHKGMIIGKNGTMLKTIGTEARIDLEAFLGTKINLQLWVKVKEDWRNKEGMLRSLGYQS